MELINFIAGPLLKVTLLLVLSGILLRLAFFSYAIIRSKSRIRDGSWWYAIAAGVRSFFPYHKAAMKKPVYALSRYIFHFGLLIVFIWGGGHIILWDFTGFKWSWTPLPDVWTDSITLCILIFIVFFLVRRIVAPGIRNKSSIGDFFLIAIVVLPCVTGYMAYHQWFDYKNTLILHMISGEAMLIVSVFLFCSTRLATDKCTGCSACTLKCPTGTLNAKENGNDRVFMYSHYQCISCGECVYVCPEKAAALRHEINFKRLFQLTGERIIRTVELTACARCGCLYGTQLQLQKIEQLIDITKDNASILKHCDRCRKLILYEKMRIKTSSS